MADFASVDDVTARLAKEAYVCDRRIATSVYLADHLDKPILVEGPAGVGKTELAKVLALALDTELVRLQCYEGLDEAKALYEWEYSKQLLYTQILRDKIGEVLGATTSLAEAVGKLSHQENAFFSEQFLLQRPLLRAIRAPRRVVLLVDEVDRADPEFEAFLLEVLSDFQVSVPELGTLKAAHRPLVVLTSNAARELTDALRRRCLYLYLGYPDKAREEAIVNARLPDASGILTAQVVALIQTLRTLDLKKSPSVSETLDWIRALTLLNVTTLDEAVVAETLNLVLKYEGDIEKTRAQLPKLIAEPR